MKKSFTILHTNDMHSNFIGMGPASDYTPFTLNDDQTRGGYARLAALIAKRKLALVARNREGRPLASRVEALDARHENSGFLLAPPGTVDRESVATGAANGTVREIKGG